MRSIIVLDNY